MPRSCMHSFDMKRFFLRFCVFSTGLLLLFILLNVYDRYRVDTVSTYAHQFAAFHAKQNPSVLILGDSHPAYGIHPGESSPYFNFATVGENWQDMLAKATVALKEKPTIKLILIPIDGHMLGEKRVHDSHESDLLHLADSSVLDPIYHKTLSSFSLNDKLWAQLLYYFPLFDAQNRYTLTKILSEDLHFLFADTKDVSTLAYDANGNVFQKYLKVWNSFPEPDRKQAAENFVKMHYAGNLVTPELRDAADRFFELCEKNHVAVIGIRFPVTREAQEEIKHYSENIVTAYYKTKPFLFTIDYEHLFDDQQEYFMDETHMNENGARSFTTILLENLEKKVPYLTAQRHLPTPLF